MITLLVPLSPYRITYAVATGRDYHDVDRLILRALHTREANSIRQMEELFRLPRRMLVEVLVALLEDDVVRVRLGSVDHFELTPSAAEAVAKGETPSRAGFRTKERTTYIMMERLTGGLIRRSDISFESRYDLHKSELWERCQPLPSEYYYEGLDEGQVRPFLRPNRGHWLYRIREIESTATGSHWLPVDVDLKAETASGIPGAWRHRLQPVLLDFGRRFAHRQTSWRFWADDSQREDHTSQRGLVAVSPNDLAVSFDQHQAWLREALDKAPKGATVFIGSPVLDPHCLDAGLSETLAGAVRRGVYVDLLWGAMAEGMSDAEGAALEKLRELRKRLGGNGIEGSLRFNTRKHGIKSSLLLVVGPENSWGVVGSFPWLGCAAKDASHKYCGLRIGSSGPLAELCWSAASLLTEAGQLLLTSPYRWRTAASELELKSCDEQPCDEKGANISRLEVVRDQAGLFPELVASAKERFLMTTARLDAYSVERISSQADKLRQIKTSIRTTHLAPDSPALPGIDLAVGMHAEVVGTESTIVISGSSALDIQPTARRSTVGIRVEGGLLPGLVWSNLAS